MREYQAKRKKAKLNTASFIAVSILSAAGFTLSSMLYGRFDMCQIQQCQHEILAASCPENAFRCFNLYLLFHESLVISSA